MFKRNIKGLMIVMLLLALAAGAAFYAEYSVLQAPLYSWRHFKNRDVVSSLGRVVLRNGMTDIYSSDGDRLWQSDKEWRVQDVLVCDVDRDGLEEIVFLVWKKGNFGKNLPYFVKENDKKTGQHIFIFRKREEEGPYLKAQWMSSALKTELSGISFSEKGRFVLTSLDGGQETHYDWEGFGLKEMSITESEQNLDNKLSFLAFGDLIVHEQIYGYASERDPEDYDFIFENIIKEAEKADIAAYVQETPFAKEDGSYAAYPQFASPSLTAAAAARAGFDVASLATNHAADLGKEGMERTAAVLKDYGIQTCGTGAENTGSCVIEKNGMKIAFASYTYGSNMPCSASDLALLNDSESVLNELSSIKADNDALIVFVHWGDEYSSKISPYQEKWTKVFYDAGVSAVIGSHPHVLQPYGYYSEGDNGRRMPVYYSLGNMISGQGKTECILGGAASFTITMSDDGEISIEDIDLIPVITHQEMKGVYTTYFYDDYSEDLMERHRLKLSATELESMFNSETELPPFLVL
ncbi:MAG: CapA family protein [Lachnospiraceae bacterium]|nr:CapA family protein [Lachnospiraceae bacterium]